MPELPEVQAHAERLTAQFSGHVLTKFVPITFTALKTAVPAPKDAYGLPLQRVGRRGKYLMLQFEPITFVVHLMQGGRLLVDEKQSAKPRGGQARFVFEPDLDAPSNPALLLTEQGTERRAGVWCVPTLTALVDLPLSKLGPEALELDVDGLTHQFAAHPGRLHGFLRDQRSIAGLGRMLANEICHRAKISPFANTAKLKPDEIERVRAAIHDCVQDGLDYERTRTDMSSSKDRPGRVHGRVGEACPVCGDTIRSVSYSSYTVAYCPTCQTGGKALADNTTSKFLK
ncbi:MAG: Formamidopyrimidine-DNA glycosylase [Ilumatobacteraceae bacterium]|nr:Formamidopyrimidine-DNA glycosylase [Ilumatobacteraceae bacterium]MCU1388494.1 Formamidopyrimidine-DNA glycosylase [Ilumatobacteraceae bacterium]